MKYDLLIFVDCEGHGPAPGLNDAAAFEFGAVHYGGDSFHGRGATAETFSAFAAWLKETCGKGHPVFVSDNPAYDWQFINYYFHAFLGHNPFGHSARRISDFYAGLTGDWSNTQRWKRLRTTKHDHNPVHDAAGNAGAFRRMLEGERGTVITTGRIIIYWFLGLLLLNLIAISLRAAQ